MVTKAEIEGIKDIGTYPKFMGYRVSALIEMACFFVVMTVLNWTVSHGNNFFDVCPHPFWIIVILISAQYGSREGVLAAVIATCMLFLGKIPAQTFQQDLFEYIYSLVKNPLFWMISAVVLGELRMRQIRERDLLQKVALEAEDREKTISDAYNALKASKENIEKRLASQMQTALTAYQAFKEIELFDPKKIVAGALNLIRVLIGPEKYSVYLLEGSQLKLAGSEGWENQDTFAQEIESDTPLFQEIVGTKRVVSVLNPADRYILSSDGLLAVPIIATETMEVFGMLKVEKISFPHLRISKIESLRMIGEWVGIASSSSRTIKGAQDNQFINKNTELLTRNFFEYQKELLISLGKRLGVDISLMSITLHGSESINAEQTQEALKTFRQVLKDNLRKLDQIFEYESNGYEVVIALVNTSLQNSEIVRKKIAEALAPKISNQISFTYQVTPLYVSQDSQ